MPRNIENILDKCLERMAQGENMEQCLADYPELADDLRPLIQTASTVKSGSASVEARPEFRAQAKQRLLAGVRAKGQEKPRSRWHSVFEWQQRWAVAAAAVIMVILVGGGTTVAASSDAMPDAFLYPVKLAVEDVRLRFAGSDINKAELQAEFADRRVDEMAKMVEEGEWGKVESTAERLSNHLEKITNVAIKKRAEGSLDEKDITKLRNTLAHYASDHPLVFEKALQNTPDDTKNAIRNALDTSRNYYANAIENVNIAVRNNVIQEASAVRTLSEAVTGIVRLIANGKWIVGEDVVSVDRTAVVKGIPKVGAAVTIEAQVMPDGSLRALKIRMIGVSFSISSATGADVSTAKPVEATPQITEVPPSGNVVRMPPVTAVEVETQLTNELPVREFSGQVRKVTDNTWTVGGRTVIVDRNTNIAGGSGIGGNATVSISVQADGALLAREITVEKNEGQLAPGLTIKKSQLNVESS